MTWQKDYGAKPATEAVAATTATPVAGNTDTPTAPAAPANGDVPAVPTAAASTDAPVDSAVQTSGLVNVKTDVLDLQIDTRGGDIVRAALPQYTESIDSKKSFVLMDHSAARTYIAQSGLIGANGPDAAAAGRPQYQVTARDFVLADGKDTLAVTLVLPQENGVEIHKVFEFTRSNYLVKVRYDIINRGTAPWNGLMYAQLKRDNSEDPSASNQGFGMMTFLGGAWWTKEKPYNKVALDDFAEEPLKEAVTGGWAAMIQHYFVSAWIPAKDSANVYTTRKSGNDNIIGYTGPQVTVAPGTQQKIEASLYVGPKIQKVLEEVSPGLELTVDYGWLWPVSQFLFWLLTMIHGWIGNWGWAIVLLTVLVKAAFFQLSATSYKSMAKMRTVMPEMQRIKEQHAGDRAKQSQAMMDLYKKEKINPLGGCLPILVQMPVFIALYYCLMESVELRHAPWLGWIRDLSVMDPYFVLPLIMGVTMWVQQHLNPAPPDPMQAKVMKIMPIVFTVMFLWFPAGLVLYWVVNNTLSILQQWVITRQIEKAAGKA
ncbi:MAG TPA: membrane protein insertase YidC [Candidatus Kapabacteria bacterium]|nr:membrane protein insertase YidC [Candidatus Kapabacteria bacterium]